jgi:hypothetical protein
MEFASQIEPTAALTTLNRTRGLCAFEPYDRAG